MKIFALINILEMDGPIGTFKIRISRFNSEAPAYLILALIMSPTRELALQTWKEANKFAKNYDIRVVCVYGGVGISEQIAELKKGAEVVR